MNKLLSKFSGLYFFSVLISLANYMVSNLYRKNAYNRLLIEIVDTAKTQDYDFFIPELVDRYFNIIDILGAAETTLIFLLLLIMTLFSFLNKSYSRVIFVLNIIMSLLLMTGLLYVIEAAVSFMLYKDIFLSYY